MKAVILVGGLGTRLRPLTDNTPKPLLPIKGRATVLRAIDNLAKHGVKDIILSMGYKADMIKEQLGDGTEFGVNIEYNVEEELLGTGGAVKDVVNKFGLKDDFVLVWGDNVGDFNISELLDAHKNNDGLITMTLTPREDVENFGVAKLEGDKAVSFVEKPKREEAPSNLINAGAFVVHPSALDILPEGKSNIERECFEILAGEGKVCAYKHEGHWFPTDTLEKYNFANDNFPAD